jgi:protocatechuate 3,4-dioxygenase beta subunit
VGISVTAFSQGPNRTSGAATTDKNGNFTLHRLTPGPYTLVARDTKGDFSSWIGQPQSVTASAASPSSNITLTLVHGGVITGRVTDKSTGKPLPNLVMTLYYAGGITSYGSLEAIQTGVDGSYTARCLPGDAVLFPSTPDISVINPLQKTIHIAEGETKSLDFQIDAPRLPAPVSGLVLDQNGNPAVGADVLAIDAEQAPQRVKSDAQGPFTFDTPGLFAQSVIMARSGELSTLNPVAYSGESSVTLHLSPGALCNLTGEVLDQDGRALPNAGVVLCRQTGPIGTVLDSTSTDSNGKYAFPHALANLTYEVSCSVDGYTPSVTNPIDIGVGESVDFPPLVAKLANSFIGGTIMDIHGKPVPDARISDNDCRDTYSDHAGHFILKGVSAQSGYIWVQVGRTIPTGFNVNVGSNDNAIRLPSTVSGIVVGPDGKAMSGAQVFIISQSPTIKPTVSDASGHFTIGAPRTKPMFITKPQMAPTPTKH